MFSNLYLYSLFSAFCLMGGENRLGKVGTKAVWTSFLFRVLQFLFGEGGLQSYKYF